MRTQELGRTGVKIPELGLGTWEYHAGPEPLQAGLDRGALFIDTAESYGSEPVVAQAIAGRRDEVFLATKVSPDHFRRADLLAALDRSLRLLKTDRVDLYQLHRPNDAVPLEETLGAVEEAIDAGKVRFGGVSNFTQPQLQQAMRLMRRHPIVSNQVRYNLVDRTIEDGLLSFCQSQHVTVIAYSPLGRGIGRLADGDPKGILARLASMTARTPAQVALNWCLSRPGVVVIPKSNTAARTVENCAASDWRLTAEQVRELDEHIQFRRRSGLEHFLRRHVPAPAQTALKRLAQLSPRALRRRLF